MKESSEGETAGVKSPFYNFDLANLGTRPDPAAV